MLSTDCRVRGPSPGYGVSSSESDGSSKLIGGGLQFFIILPFLFKISYTCSTHRCIIGQVAFYSCRSLKQDI